MNWLKGALIGLACFAGQAHAQTEPTAAPAPPSLDPAAIAAFFSAEIEPALQASGAPGAVVVVVRHDAIVFAQGYGFADVAARTPVNATTTLFETASVGKTMTALVAAQLAREGLINLDQDVNTYLTSTHVTSSTPVTLRMLLGHQGGFDSDLTRSFARFDAGTNVSRGELDRRLQVLRRPGVSVAYDNQGYGVIALVLEDVTGKSLRQLFAERIFAPAGMSGAVLGRPEDGAARLARCYVAEGQDRRRDCEFWLYRRSLAGAGGVSASGYDMARYMQLWLGDGVVEGAQVIAPEIYGDITNFDHYRFHPALPGAGFAFFQDEEFRGRLFMHSGHMPGFSTMMKIYRDADIGVFVSFMGGQPPSFDSNLSSVVAMASAPQPGPEARAALIRLETLSDRFAERFIPANWPRSSESGAGLGDISMTRPFAAFPGTYVQVGGESQSFVHRIGGWLRAIEVRAVHQDAIEVAGQGPFRLVGHDVFENDERRRVAFADRDGELYLALGMSPAQFRRTNALETPIWTLPLFAVALLVCLTALVHVLRRRAHARLSKLSRLSLIGLVLVLAGLCAEWQWGVSEAIVKGAIIAPALWRLGLHLGVAAMVWAVADFVFDRSRLGVLGVSHGGLIALADVALLTALAFWGVIGAFPPYFSW